MDSLSLLKDKLTVRNLSMVKHYLIYIPGLTGWHQTITITIDGRTGHIPAQPYPWKFILMTMNWEKNWNEKINPVVFIKKKNLLGVSEHFWDTKYKFT